MTLSKTISQTVSFNEPLY